MYGVASSRQVGSIFDVIKKGIDEISDHVTINLPELVIRGPGGAPITSLPDLTVGFESPKTGFQLPAIPSVVPSWVVPAAIAGVVLIMLAPKLRGR